MGNQKTARGDPMGAHEGQRNAGTTSSTEETLHTPPSRKLTIVGIGASAGGLSALKRLFADMPADTGFAFVVVVHLSPEHKSHLAELLQPHIHIPVQQVTETVSLAPNRVFLIPPGANLSAIDTHLRLSKLEERRQERAPIDHFFRTLAKSHDGPTVGVILTGTGSDGTLGIKEIKQSGGLTIVQDPNDAEYDGMPQSAIATGLVDLVLPLAQIPAAILRFASVQPRLSIPRDDQELEHDGLSTLQKVFAYLRAHTGRDFARYKRSTILRRIERRMQLLQIEEFPHYLQRLHEQPDEVRTLADDLLITVTSFFRDHEVFAKLEAQVVPQLFQGKAAADEVRVWSVGCATGEEAYSLAILLLEEAARREVAPRLRVFASDLHENSLKRARDGFYPGDIETDVSSERLKRFFLKEDGGYRVRKDVRELVTFAPHNLFSDPPFSRLDLISCRNVLIYIEREVQRQVLGVFHYALRQGGFLVLGTSETVDRSEMFRVADKKHHVYVKRSTPLLESRPPALVLARTRFQLASERAELPDEPISVGTLHTRLVGRYALPSALISPEDKVAYLSEDAGRYLVHPSGDLTASIFRLLRDELRVELRSLLSSVRARNESRRSRPILVDFKGRSAHVILHVHPSPDRRHAGFVLISFEETLAKDAHPPRLVPALGGRNQEAREVELETELTVLDQRLRTIIEEYEVNREEMRASNEEMQSTNEELRSTLEELETSKEELQSINEELQTVSQENRHKVEELAQLSADLQNLLAATNIATLFLDCNLRILRFTPQVAGLFNIRLVDRGRPITDLTHRLGYDELPSDAAQVLERFAPVEREVADGRGRWFMTSVMPYRGSAERVEGVVITFVDITRRKLAEHDVQRLVEQLQEADRRKDEFLAMLSHELRNPLAPLWNFLELMRAAPDKAACYHEIGPVIERQTQTLITLVNDLLEVSRIKHGKISLQRKPTDLADIIRSVVDAVRPLFASTGHRLELELTKALVVNADAVRISQSLHNLLENAAKYSPPGSRVILTSKRQGDHAFISVRDFGIGIPADHLEHIFGLFTQLDQPATNRQGLGIGLALAKQLIELHEGTIEVCSEGLNQGSEFIVRLPLSVDAVPDVTNDPAQPPVALAGTRRVLVVDDNVDAATVLSLLLGSLGHEVRQASNGRDAVTVAEEFGPHFVLMDLGMPVLDGYQAVKEMRRHEWGKRMTIVALTGWGHEEDRAKSIQAGFDGHLVKPVDLEVLEQLLAECEHRGSH